MNPVKVVIEQIRQNEIIKAYWSEVLLIEEHATWFEPDYVMEGN